MNEEAYYCFVKVVGNLRIEKHQPDCGHFERGTNMNDDIEPIRHVNMFGKVAYQPRVGDLKAWRYYYDPRPSYAWSTERNGYAGMMLVGRRKALRIARRYQRKQWRATWTATDE